jgi:hypothetical protein
VLTINGLPEDSANRSQPDYHSLFALLVYCQ